MRVDNYKVTIIFDDEDNLAGGKTDCAGNGAEKYDNEGTAGAERRRRTSR